MKFNLKKNLMLSLSTKNTSEPVVLPSKWIERKKFSEGQADDSLAGHANTVFSYKKPQKSEKWYLKFYREFPFNYEVEATASDFYRFILGKERAAKSQVVYDEGCKIGVISQHNPCGFESSLSIYLRTREDYLNGILNVKNGRCEVMIANHILHEADGNPSNVGLNGKGEVSRIDYDGSFCRDKSRFPAIVKIYLENELLVNSTGDIKVINRFYKTMLKIVLLHEITNSSTICDRHAMYPEMKSQLAKRVVNNVTPLKPVILNSDGFIRFMQNFDATELINECSDFFKHEHKKFPQKYNDCMKSIDEVLDSIKRSGLANKFR